MPIPVAPVNGARKKPGLHGAGRACCRGLVITGKSVTATGSSCRVVGVTAAKCSHTSGRGGDSPTSTTAAGRGCVGAIDAIRGAGNPQTVSESFRSPLRLGRQRRCAGTITTERKLQIPFAAQVPLPRAHCRSTTMTSPALPCTQTRVSRPVRPAWGIHPTTRGNLPERHKRRFPEERLRSVDSHSHCAPGSECRRLRLFKNGSL